MRSVFSDVQVARLDTRLQKALWSGSPSNELGADVFGVFAPVWICQELRNEYGNLEQIPGAIEEALAREVRFQIPVSMDPGDYLFAHRPYHV